MKKLTIAAMIAVLPLLSGCETMQAIRDFKVSDYINLPWENKKAAEPTRTAEATPVKTPEVPVGLQQDDLRTPFGDNQTAVASR
jgi:hypothetical protein